MDSSNSPPAILGINPDDMNVWNISSSAAPPVHRTNDFEEEVPVETFAPSTSGLQRKRFQKVLPPNRCDSDESDIEDLRTTEGGSVRIDKLDKYGHIPGVVAGAQFKSRKELRESGVHRSHSICCFREEGLLSVTLHDYLLVTDEGDFILLSGYRQHTGTMSPIKNSELVSALLKNVESKMPVRVIRSSYFRTCPKNFRPKKGYRYDGLYEVVHADYNDGSFYSILRRFKDQPPIPGFDDSVSEAVSQLCKRICSKKDRDAMVSDLFEEDVKTFLFHPDDSNINVCNIKSDELYYFDGSDDELEFELEEREVPPEIQQEESLKHVFAETYPALMTKTEGKSELEDIRNDPPDCKEPLSHYKCNISQYNTDCKTFKNELANSGKNIEENKTFYDFTSRGVDDKIVEPKCCRHSPESEMNFVVEKAHDCIYNLTLRQILESIFGSIFKICPCIMPSSKKPVSNEFEAFLEYIICNPGKASSVHQFEKKLKNQALRMRKRKSNSEVTMTSKNKTVRQKQFGVARKTERKASSPTVEGKGDDLHPMLVDAVVQDSPEGRRTMLDHTETEETTNTPDRTRSRRIGRPRCLRAEGRSTLTRRSLRGRRFIGQRELASLYTSTPQCQLQEYSFPRRSPRKKSKHHSLRGHLGVSEIDFMNFEGFTLDEIKKAEENRMRLPFPYEEEEKKSKGFKGFSGEEVAKAKYNMEQGLGIEDEPASPVPSGSTSPDLQSDPEEEMNSLCLPFLSDLSDPLSTEAPTRIPTCDPLSIDPHIVMAPSTLL